MSSTDNEAGASQPPTPASFGPFRDLGGLIIAIALFALAALVFFDATTYPERRNYGNFGPAIFPFMVASGIVLMSLLTLMLGGVAIVVSNPANNESLSLIAAVLVVALIALFVFLYHPRLGPWAQSLARRLSARFSPRVAGYVTPVIDAMRRFHGFSAADHLEVLAWAVASIMLRILMLWFAMLAMGIDVAPIHILWMSAVLLFTAALPLTVANLGIREGFLVIALAPFGVSSSTAVALGLLIFVNQIAFAAVGGAYQLALALDLVPWKTPRTQAAPEAPMITKTGPNSL